MATRSLPVAELREVAAGLGIDVDEDDVTFEELTHNRMSQITEGIWRVRSGGFQAVVKLTRWAEEAKRILHEAPELLPSVPTPT